MEIIFLNVLEDKWVSLKNTSEVLTPDDICYFKYASSVNNHRHQSEVNIFDFQFFFSIFQ